MGSTYLWMGGSITLSGAYTPANFLGMRPAGSKGRVPEADFAGKRPPTSDEEPRDAGIIAEVATTRQRRAEVGRPTHDSARRQSERRGMSSLQGCHCEVTLMCPSNRTSATGRLPPAILSVGT